MARPGRSTSLPRRTRSDPFTGDPDPLLRRSLHDPRRGAAKGLERRDGDVSCGIRLDSVDSRPPSRRRRRARLSRGADRDAVSTGIARAGCKSRLDRVRRPRLASSCRRVPHPRAGTDRTPLPGPRTPRRSAHRASRGRGIRRARPAPAGGRHGATPTRRASPLDDSPSIRGPSKWKGAGRDLGGSRGSWLQGIGNDTRSRSRPPSCRCTLQNFAGSPFEL